LDFGTFLKRLWLLIHSNHLDKFRLLLSVADLLKLTGQNLMANFRSIKFQRGAEFAVSKLINKEADIF
jgi:hypothetical protein